MHLVWQGNLGGDTHAADGERTNRRGFPTETTGG